MRYSDWNVEMPRTARAWVDSHADLEGVVEADLLPHSADLAEGGCSSGGWPDDEEIIIAALKVEGDELRVEVDVHFNEVIPSACKDFPYRETRHRRLVVTLERGSSIGSIDLSASDTEGWSREDRNSAADGT